MQKLKNTDQFFEAIFAHATMGIIVTDNSGTIVLANDFALGEFGYEADELTGKQVETLIPKRFHKQHSHERDAYYSNASTRAMGAGRDLYGRRSDGSEFPVEVSLSPLETNEGGFVIAFIVNISLRREKETAVQAYQQQISDIQQSLRKEKELNDMKSRFVSMASHEFKTPLSTILSSASLLAKYTRTEEQRKRDKHIERIKSAVGNLNAILNEFLSIGKMENGEMGVHYMDFDLKILIAGLCKELEDIKKPGQRINYAHQGPTKVTLDRDLLRNIMINLLSNAVKFSGGNGMVQINSENTPEQTQIIISDNGVGISEEDQAHLFELFFRGSNVLTISGTGLGLHIVGKYVELMDGTIKLNSTLGKGTEIILRFKR